jgi:hypothetical protein
MVSGLSLWNVIGCCCLAFSSVSPAVLPSGSAYLQSSCSEAAKFLWADCRLKFCSPFHNIMPVTLVHYDPFIPSKANPKKSASVHNSVTNNWNCKNRFLAACFMLPSTLAYLSTLKMEETCPTETSVDFQRIIRCYLPEDRTLLNHSKKTSNPKLSYFVSWKSQLHETVKGFN